MAFPRVQNLVARPTLIRRAAHAFSAHRWAFRDFRGRPPQRFKVATIRAYSSELGYRVFVETGTAYGDMLNSIADSFDLCFSIEADADRFRVASSRMARQGRVKIYLGNSAALLPSVLAQVHAPAVFWLDAHPADGKKGPVPLLEELRAILEHPSKGHAILIDDVSQLGTLDWPPLSEIERTLVSSGRCTNIHVAHDILRARLDP